MVVPPLYTSTILPPWTIPLNSKYFQQSTILELNFTEFLNIQEKVAEFSFFSFRNQSVLMTNFCLADNSIKFDEDSLKFDINH